MIDQLSPEEIERMRAIVQQHDQTNKSGIKEFDLNSPPRVPYRFQEYPKTIYDHDGRRSFIVRNREDEREALESGLRLEPFPSEPVEAEPEAEAAEIEKLDKQARKPRKQ